MRLVITSLTQFIVKHMAILALLPAPFPPLYTYCKQQKGWGAPGNRAMVNCVSMLINHNSCIPA